MNIIHVGSKNIPKVKTVRETLQGYDFLKPFQIKSLDVSSGVSEQPFGLDQITLGSKNRAKNSFLNCNYSIGIESGLIEIPYSDYFADICVCSIFNGNIFYPSGISEGFAIPKNIAEIIFEEGLDLSQATRKVGLTNSKKIGAKKGIISILTNGRFVRGNQIQKALQMALISLEKPHFYESGPGGI